MTDINYKNLLSTTEYEAYLRLVHRDKDIIRSCQASAFLRKPYWDLGEPEILSKVGVRDGYIAIAVFKQSWTRCNRAPVYEQRQVQALLNDFQGSTDLRALTFTR